ncbi:hypothetical protein [Corynebacterium marquesiae]|uniref:hypothetical protein n=1 Tax=Corynebacterium marquesiae TaxID=2913503 RepID=UPI004042D5F2
MSNPTRQEIIEAHDALDEMLHHILSSSGRWSSEARDQILKALPPKPRPTMAEVEWDNRKHFLAVVEVDHEKYKRAIMLKQDVPGEVIECFALHPNKCVVGYFSPDMLTLTGKRYTLTEVQE